MWYILGMKTVLITGVGKGLGRALAEKFLVEGYSVIGTLHGGPSPFSHEHLKLHELDLALDGSREKCISEIIESGVKMDILINNAGILADEEETTVIADKLRQTLEVNLIGTIDFTERLLSIMNDDGHIINISSSAGSLDGTGHSSHFEGHYPAYKISKAAINMYTRTLALRLKGKITVSSVHPGCVKTGMGGEKADTLPEEAAVDIFDFALSSPKSGEFWFKGVRMPW